ncbi:STAS domain-containing protein [Alteribacter lacisalsi]|nr:STAS domain-containing protein [Alteribacter lacisalsi]
MMSENHMIRIGEAIKANSRTMAHQLFSEYDEKYHFNHNFGRSEEDVAASRVELFTLLGKALTDEDDNLMDEVYKWGKNAGKAAVSHGISADMALLALSPARRVIYRTLKEELIKSDLGFDAFFDVSDRVNAVLDQAIYAFTQAYVEYHDETFSQAQEELLELSVPVVPLTSTVAILPVIGTIDTHRSKKMLNQALERGSELSLNYLIIDLSGVHIIDTAVAHNLFQLNDALKVTGITAIISGLRPELAQTIVNLGISFNHMTVTSRLEQALEKTGLVIKTEEEAATETKFDTATLKKLTM